jgi:DnaJ-class molecular chaperone
MSKFIRIRHEVSLICKRCLGGGYVATNHGAMPCPMCRGTGSVPGWAIELVSVEETEDASK